MGPSCGDDFTLLNKEIVKGERLVIESYSYHTDLSTSAPVLEENHAAAAQNL